VATPGRLMDMKERGHLHFDNTRFAVLDEVDRMLDIGFRDDIRQILKQMPPDRQTVFVSATISPEIENLSRTFMDEPERLTTTGSSLTVSLVEQFYISVEPWDKRRMLKHILKEEEPELTIVFCRTKRTVDKVAKYLTDNGLESEGIHGDMYQGKRNTVIRRLREGRLRVLVASDLAARGLDVDGITHVVNYDLPDDPEIYIHRIGRTARAGRDGIAWAFVTPDQGGLLTDIEKLANTHVEPKEYPKFNPGPVPSDIRDERARDRRRVEQKQSTSRYESAVPVAKKVDESKFPGGIVPTKRPPKALRGRVKTARSMKDAPKDDEAK
ncbi:MAG: DEAD/DEAH box helicase, partial [Planctomycetota bacterium]